MRIFLFWPNGAWPEGVAKRTGRAWGEGRRQVAAHARLEHLAFGPSKVAHRAAKHTHKHPTRGDTPESRHGGGGDIIGLSISTNCPPHERGSRPVAAGGVSGSR